MPLSTIHKSAVPNSGNTSIWNPPSPVVDDDHSVPPPASLSPLAITTAPSNKPTNAPPPLTTSLQICTICNEAISLYRCPRCSIRTCSLTCCRIHKSRGDGCNGLRDRVAFTSLRNFSDSTVLSDYHFLEDVLTVQESGKRVAGNLKGGEGRGRPQDAKRRKRGVPEEEVARNDSILTSPLLESNAPNSQTKSNTAFILKACGVQPHPPPSSDKPTEPNTTDPQDEAWLLTQPPAKQRLVHQARERNVRLLLMPAMMQRHVMNKTTRYDAKKDSIFWKVDFCFHSFAPKNKEETDATMHHTKTILSVNQIQDTDTISSHLSVLLKRHLSHSADATTRSILKPFSKTTTTKHSHNKTQKMMEQSNTIPTMTPKMTSSHDDTQTNKTKKKALLTNTSNHHHCHFLADHVGLLLKRLPCRSSRPSYRNVDVLLPTPNDAGVVGLEPSTTTLGTILRGSTVIEYPTIEVVLEKDRKYFPNLVEEVVSSSSESDSSDCSSTTDSD